MQEAVYALRPDVLLETGIAHGGSLIFYASLFKAIGHGRVIGVDIEIRPHNRTALEDHPLRPLLTLVEGSSVESTVVAQVKSLVAPGERVLLVLDSAHGRDHVRAELEAYADLVGPGGYIAVADWIMRDVVGLPRTAATWSDDNPVSAVDGFLAAHPEFERAAPARPFDETGGVPDVVTYFRSGWMRRVR
jgi:cephalosporin hydroxylase